MWIYSAETTTDYGLGNVVALNWLFSSFVGVIFPLIIEEKILSLSYLFLIYSVLSVFSLLFVCFFIVETKGLSYKEIQNKYYSLS